MGGDYVKLGDLFVYKISLELSDEAWNVYKYLNWQEKKIMGDQFVRSVDSVGANIAEGYGRYHYLDKIKFYYNSRGSLLEVKHWAYRLHKREKIVKEEFVDFIKLADNVHFHLNKD